MLLTILLFVQTPILIYCMLHEHINNGITMCESRKMCTVQVMNFRKVYETIVIHPYEPHAVSKETMNKSLEIKLLGNLQEPKLSA